MWRKWALGVFVAGLILAGCQSTDEVSKFAANAGTTLQEGQSVLKDWGESCVREKLAQSSFSDFDSQRSEAEAACKSSNDVQNDQLAIANALSKYFSALSQLAAGTSSTAQVSDAQAALSSASSSTPHYEQVVGFIGKWYTQTYTIKKVAGDVQAADSAVAALTGAQADVIEKNYAKRLDREQDTLRQRYTSFLGHVQRTPDLKAAEPVVTVMFNSQWQADTRELDAKRAAAAAYVDALRKIRDGHHALAQKNISYTAPGLRGLLGPYTAVLQNALMTIHKAF